MRGENGEFLPLYLYPRFVLDNPPSVRSGFLSAEDEAKNRALGCLLIAKAGHMLTLSDSCDRCDVREVLLHRFYFRVNMHAYKLLRVCMTCVHVAGKVEETPVRLRCVLAAFDRLLKRRAGLDPSPLSEARFNVWASGVSSCEGVLLRELGFELYVDLPHAFILHFLNYLHPRIEDSPPAEQALWAALRQRSWNALNDALFSSKLLFAHKPHVVACGAIVVAASLLGLALPEAWWQLFDVDTGALDRCAIDFARLYALLHGAGAEEGGQLEYTPAHADDNAETNELCRYRAQNRQRMLAERRRLEAEKRAAAALQQQDTTIFAAAASSTGTADADERKAESGAAPQANSSADTPMET